MINTLVSSAIILALEPKMEENPVKAILSAIPPIAAIQLIDAYIFTRDLFNSFLTLVLAALLTPVVALTLVLFGAPATTHLLETLLCAALLTKITLQPMFARYGLEHSHWKNAMSLDLPFTDAYGGLLGGVLGAWLGAIPIALDWDRPWQQWPTTILLGSTIGTLVGNIAGYIASWSKEDKYSLEKQKKADKKAEKAQREKVEKIRLAQQKKQAEANASAHKQALKQAKKEKAS